MSAAQLDSKIAGLRQLLDEGIANRELGPRGSLDPIVREIEGAIGYLLRRQHSPPPRMSRLKRAIVNIFTQPRANSRAAEDGYRDESQASILARSQTAVRRHFITLVEIAYHDRIPESLKLGPDSCNWPELRMICSKVSTAFCPEVTAYLVSSASRLLDFVERVREHLGDAPFPPIILSLTVGLRGFIVAIANNALNDPRGYTIDQYFLTQCDFLIEECMAVLRGNKDIQSTQACEEFKIIIGHFNASRDDYKEKVDSEKNRFVAPFEQLIPEHLGQNNRLTPKKVLEVLREYINVRVFAKEQFQVIRSVGYGGFGIAEEADLNQFGRVVVKKVPITGMDSSLRPWEVCARILRETRVMVKVDHRHIIPLLGICLPENEDQFCPSLILPFCKEGNMKLFLSEQPQTLISCKLQLLLDIVRGLEYLHFADPPIIHGDLKANNILVKFWEDSGRYEACICDFGLSRILDDFHRWSSGALHGNMRWQAPEVVRVRWEKPKENDPALNTTLNANTDMYALGCIFLEMVTGEIPYSVINDPDTVRKTILSRPYPTPDLYLRESHSFEPEHIGFMRKCWSHDVDQRPSAKMALRELEELRHEHNFQQE